jgi:hypothetical protein
MSFSSIRAWLETVAGIPVLKEPLNGPKPNTDHATVQVLATRGSCYPIVIKAEVDEDLLSFTADNPIDYVLDVNVYADDGDTVLNDIKATASLPYSNRPIMASCGDIRDLSWLDDTSHKPRWQCEFTFRDSHVKTVNDPRVKSTQITGDFAGIDSEVEHP